MFVRLMGNSIESRRGAMFAIFFDMKTESLYPTYKI